MILYSLRSADGEFRITKFDHDLNPESSYIVAHDGCECPQWQGRGVMCRHMKMLPLMKDRLDTPWFYCYDDGKWYDPTGQAEEHEISRSIDRVNAMRPYVRHAGDSVVEGPTSDAPTDLDLLKANPPEGVTIIGLDNPETLHNTIAKAIGEPPIRRRV